MSDDIEPLGAKRDTSKDASYYAAIVAELEAARKVYPKLPPQDWRKYKQHRGSEHYPFTDAMKNWLLVIRQWSPTDQINAVLLRDQTIGSAFLTEHIGNAEKQISECKKEKQEILVAIRTRVQAVELERHATISEFNASLELLQRTRPNHTRFSRFLTSIGISSTQQRAMDANDQAVAFKQQEINDARRTYASKFSQAEEQAHEKNSLARLDNNIHSFDSKKNHYWPQEVNAWLDKGKKIAAEIVADAAVIDADPALVITMDKLFRSDYVSESEWIAYAKAVKIVAKVAGFEAARLPDPATGHLRHARAESNSVTYQFDEILDRQKPDHIVRIEEARKRLVAAAAAATAWNAWPKPKKDEEDGKPEGRGSRERSMIDDMIAAAEACAHEAHEREEERERQEDEKRRKAMDEQNERTQRDSEEHYQRILEWSRQEGERLADKQTRREDEIDLSIEVRAEQNIKDAVNELCMRVIYEDHLAMALDTFSHELEDNVATAVAARDRIIQREIKQRGPDRGRGR
jgi:hypothetical protein